MLLSAVYVARHRRLELIGAAGLTIVWLVLSRTNLNGGLREGSLIADAVLVALLILCLVLVGTFSAGEVTTDTLCGAVSIYLLIGTTWAVTFSVLEALQAGSLQ